MSRTFKLYLIPAIILLAVTVPHLEQGDFRRDSGRYAAVGLYMWDGGQLLAPHLDPETPYFNKPPLALLIHGAFLKVFGPSLVVARIPSILAAVAVALLSMLALRQIASRAEAVTSGIVLALSYEFFRRTREISLDLWQLVFMMAAVCCITRALRNKSRGSLVVAGVPLGFALLCKPLVGLICIPVFAVWFVLAGQKRLVLWLLVGTLPLALAVAAPWHLYMYAVFGHQFTGQYFMHEVVDRARGLLLKKPFGFYLKQLATTYWPWLAVAIFAVVYRTRRNTTRPAQREVVWISLTWVVVWILALSAFPDKKPNYGLPLYPMLSWLAAWGLCRIPWRKLRVWYEAGLPWLAPGFAALAIGLSMAPIQFQRSGDAEWRNLFDWTQRQKVDVTRLTHGELGANEICYFYLKTGSWLPSVKPARHGGIVKDLLVLADTRAGAKTNGMEVVFVSGGLVVYKHGASRGN